MVKKMWAKLEKEFFPKKYTSCGKLVCDGTTYINKDKLKKFLFKKFKKKDPFENVRKFLNERKSYLGGEDIIFKYTLMLKSIQKDIKNFDEGAG